MINNVDALFNHANTIIKMARAEKLQEAKFSANKRCKAPNWGGVVNYIEYATGLKATEEEVRKASYLYI